MWPTFLVTRVENINAWVAVLGEFDRDYELKKCIDVGKRLSLFFTYFSLTRERLFQHRPTVPGISSELKLGTVPA